MNWGTDPGKSNVMINKKTRKIKWVKTYHENHWLDCEVYNLFCAELMNVFNEDFIEENIEENEKENYIPQRNWFGGN